MQTFDKKKIAVIVCVNDDRLFEEAVYYLEKQNLPDGFFMEILPVRGASSITSGYNWAMEKSDARYKVYMHQDVFLVYRETLRQIVHIFQQDAQIGMAGMIGCAKAEKRGCWWNSKRGQGAYTDNHIDGMKFYRSGEKSANGYMDIEMADGLFLATQYDVRWREDVFDGWHFYDASQCMEFLRCGYKIVVPWQDFPWFVHDCGVLFNLAHDYERQRERFIREYSGDARLFKKT